MDDMPKTRFAVFHFRTRLPGRLFGEVKPTPRKRAAGTLRTEASEGPRPFGPLTDGASPPGGTTGDFACHKAKPFRLFRVFRGEISHQVKTDQIDKPLPSFQPHRWKLFGK